MKEEEEEEKKSRKFNEKLTIHAIAPSFKCMYTIAAFMGRQANEDGRCRDWATVVINRDTVTFYM